MQSLHDFMPSKRQRKRSFLQAAGAALAAAALPQTAHPATPVTVRVAAASDLKFALARVVKPFELETGIKVELNFGSSGNFARQILQGLPVDLFMSADEDWAFKVADAGLSKPGATERGVVYAQGRIALLLPKRSPIRLDADLLGLRAQWASVRKFAIANPEHAPYGRAAQQALTALGMWDTVQPKLVLGENIAQASLFVTSGAAQAGISALSLAAAPELAAVSEHIALPERLHAPLRQRMLLLKTASPSAQQLFDYLQSAGAVALFKSAGLGL